MRDNENNLLSKLEQLHVAKSLYKTSEAAIGLSQEIVEFQKKLQDEPLGVVSKAFIETPLFGAWIEENYWDHEIYYWYKINHYLLTRDITTLEEAMDESLNIYAQKNATGMVLPSKGLFSPRLIRTVHLSKDNPLIKLFCSKLPLPHVELFQGGEIPDVIAHEAAQIEAIKKKYSAPHDVEKIINLQRTFRSRRRQREELNRVNAIYSDYLHWHNITAEQLLTEANNPYLPRCENPILAQRIFDAAAKIELFSSVSHLTAGSSIEKIFDDALYGRRTLLQFYHSFRQAALMGCDVSEGDANVICLGAQDIDPLAIQSNTMKIEFDLKKLVAAKNPTIFFKQRDLGFGKRSLRQVSFPGSKSQPLFFDHTEQRPLVPEHFSSLRIYQNRYSISAREACLPNISFISYEVKKIHQILILNFFKFLDQVCYSTGDDASEAINETYMNISQLNDEELGFFLKDLGRKFSDTSEFNFYGAHQIDFSTILSISSHVEEPEIGYTLSLPCLIMALNEGRFAELEQAKENLPEVFRSHRFVDYLIAEVTHQGSLTLLSQIREDDPLVHRCTP